MTWRIDAHLHLWRLARADYGWITPDLAPLRRDFEPADAKAELERAGVAGAVLVQAAPTVAETRFLLEHADAHDWILGVVGWVDLEAADAPDQIAALAEHPKLKGIRPMIQDIRDPEWMLGPAITPALRAVRDLDLAFDALVTPRHLDALVIFLERHDDLRVVVDHGAKPNIAQGALEPWASRMTAIGRSSNAFCKLSGLLTEAGPDWTIERIRPYADRLLEAFGAERLMFGSDWPVLTLAADYQGWLGVAEALLDRLGQEDRSRIWASNAAGFYRLP